MSSSRPDVQVASAAASGNYSKAISGAVKTAGSLAGPKGSGLILKARPCVYSSNKLKNKAIKAKLAKLEKDYQGQLKGIGGSLAKLAIKPPSGDEPPPTAMHPDVPRLIHELRPVLAQLGLTLESIAPSLEAIDTTARPV